MKIRSLNYISSWFLVLVLFSGTRAFAQDLSADSTVVKVDSLIINDISDIQVEEDTTKVDYPFISGFSILLDYGKLLTYWTNFERKSEVGVQLNIKGPLHISGEYGMGSLTPQNAYDNADYESVGSYYRVGLGYSIAINQESNLSLGVKHAGASYEDKGVVRIASSSGIHDDLESPFSRSDLTARWYEVVLGTESRLRNRLYLGAHFRVRVMIDYDEQIPVDTYAIPGYGRTFDNTVPVVNLYLRYELFSKTK